jgi:hypothetical protein
MESPKIKHEVWLDKEGLTCLCLSDERGNDAREMLGEGRQFIHSFYASSHFEAMTIYYQYMDWGEYKTIFEIDKEPYDH